MTHEPNNNEDATFEEVFSYELSIDNFYRFLALIQPFSGEAKQRLLDKALEFWFEISRDLEKPANGKHNFVFQGRCNFLNELFPLLSPDDQKTVWELIFAFGIPYGRPTRSAPNLPYSIQDALSSGFFAQIFDNEKRIILRDFAPYIRGEIVDVFIDIVFQTEGGIRQLPVYAMLRHLSAQQKKRVDKQVIHIKRTEIFIKETISHNIDLEEAQEWYAPRFGTDNPTRMNNPVWEYLIETGINAFAAGDLFDWPDPFNAGPGWCFSRWGQSVTPLPDGRVIYIAGEHEDSYDPDFHIYNDVVVKHPNGQIDIFCYPASVFPPTDSHTATLIGDLIYIIGRIGYHDFRQPGHTPVYCLDVNSFAISRVETAGSLPGYIYGHKANRTAGNQGIHISGGKVIEVETFEHVTNFKDWHLDLTTMQWQQVSKNDWQQWTIRRADGRLMEFPSKAIRLEKLRKTSMVKEDEEALYALACSLFQPPLPHELVEKDRYWETHVIRVEGVDIVYALIRERSSTKIEVTARGEISAQAKEILQTDFCQKLAGLERVPCVCE